MTDTEYLERYTQRIMAVTGWPRDAVERVIDPPTVLEDIREEDDPEGAADDEMSYWTD